MAGTAFDDVNNLPDPAIAWRFGCTFPTINGLTIADTYLDKATLPQELVESANQYVAGSFVYYPTTMNSSDVELTFYEDRSFSVFKYLTYWRRQVLDDDGNYGLPKDYKKELDFTLYDQTGATGLTLRYVGAWPKGPAAYNMDSESSGRLLTVCSMSLDSAFPVNI